MPLMINQIGAKSNADSHASKFHIDSMKSSATPVDASKYVKEKSLLVVRMKPKGVGEMDKNLTAENKYQNKEYVGCSNANHSVTFRDK